jgi:hypothetical protein
MTVSGSGSAEGLLYREGREPEGFCQADDAVGHDRRGCPLRHPDAAAMVDVWPTPL